MAHKAAARRHEDAPVFAPEKTSRETKARRENEFLADADLYRELWAERRDSEGSYTAQDSPMWDVEIAYDKTAHTDLTQWQNFVMGDIRKAVRETLELDKDEVSVYAYSKKLAVNDKGEQIFEDNLPVFRFTLYIGKPKPRKTVEIPEAPAKSDANA